MSHQTHSILSEKISFDDFRQDVLRDYFIAVQSREASLIGRKEVLTGKAKFGIFGDGKEIAQIAMAKVFREGDFRSGYYRDQTFIFASGMSKPEAFFAQLYAHPDLQAEPSSGGRQMNGHYATPFLDASGNWLGFTARKNSSADISPTAGQMVRGLGLAFASKLFRNQSGLATETHLSDRGNEVCFTTIGDASTSEGLFWETLNAAGVLQVPLAVFVWDDGYGISVPRKFQTTKNSVSEILQGFQYEEGKGGLDIYTVKGWDYPSLCTIFRQGIQKIRDTHIPAVFHVQELTQPQGHSTSGSHERYKSRERLEWEKEMDCLKKMKEFILENAIASEDDLMQLESEAKQSAHDAKKRAWQQFIQPLQQQVREVISLSTEMAAVTGDPGGHIQMLATQLAANPEPLQRDLMKFLYRLQRLSPDAADTCGINARLTASKEEAHIQYSAQLYSEQGMNARDIQEVTPVYTGDSPSLNGFEILNRYFDHILQTRPDVFAFGEDVGHIGDVNQGFAGLQEKHGKWRVFDTGIREASIIGQGIGMAMRGLRPIAEIQYLDYLLYALQPLSDDVSTLLWRTRGQQKCPLIVRTRGHRLEGVWHSGSPMGMMLHALRGMYICVPRNMVQAAAMYNTLLQCSEPAVVVECLNGYRLKEQVPENLTALQQPLGIPEILTEGDDCTLVSYGSTLRVIQEAMQDYLQPAGIHCELIDVQTLLPFDRHHRIVDSLKKTGRILFIDEDVPGGATSYMMQQVLEGQGGYRWLDAQPRTLSAKEHRPAYGSDGDYFSKPNAEDIAEAVFELMRE